MIIERVGATQGGDYSIYTIIFQLEHPIRAVLEESSKGLLKSLALLE